MGVETNTFKTVMRELAAHAEGEAPMGCRCCGKGYLPEVDAEGYSTGRETYCNCDAGVRREKAER